MARFFVTGVGGDVAQSVCKIIKDNIPDAFLLGSDIAEYHAGSLFVDAFRRIPHANSPDYITAIASLIDEFNIDFLLPMPEPEIEALTDLPIGTLSCKVIAPGKKVVEFCMDKHATNRFLSLIGVEVPWTVDAEGSLPESYPCIFKGRRGAGSKLVHIVENETDAIYLSKKYRDCIFQELLLPNDNEVTCAVFRSSNGAVSILQLHRILSGGATSWAKVIYNEEIEAMCKLVARELDLLGSINIQLRITENGPRIFEINPRFSSSVLMRHIIGFEDVIWSIDDAMGHDISFAPIEVGSELVRVFDARILSSGKG